MVRTFSRVDAFLGSHYPFVVLGCVIAGLLFPGVFSRLREVNIALFAFVTFANSLGGSFRDLAKVILHPLPVVTVLLLLHVVMPLAALGLGTLLFPDAPLFTMGLVLEYAVPCGISSLMWVGMAGGNLALCLSVLLLDTLLAPFVIPLTLQILCGSVIRLHVLDLMGDLMFMVAIPALLAMTLRQFAGGRVAAALKPRLSLPAKLVMLLIITVNATGCAPFLRDLNGTLALVIAAVFVLCLLGFFLGYWAGRLLKQPFPSLIAMSFNSGYRNISVGAVLASQFFPPDVLFPVAFTPLFLQLTASVVIKALLATKPGRTWRAQREMEKAASS